ncbi:hypothetical protein LTR36_008521 [Oleoguttula mirabilis]|uniref:Uncharacterized protein n=1 Tax=Oleoguttula mirabilis TaxID=1507867 RepID=A0AAV9JSW0_9PEZI|nr:hypothetical protein LTR36_008521 [Oleoguttula mirabilis]
MISFLRSLIGLDGTKSAVEPAASTSFDIRLPAEIRLRIYGYVLHSDHRLKRPDGETPRDRHAHTSILAVSKLVHHEAVDVLYENNTFVLELGDILRSDGSEAEPIIDTQLLDGKSYGNLQIMCNLHCTADDARKRDLTRVLSVLRVSRHLSEVRSPKLQTVLFRLGNNNFNSLTHVLGSSFAGSGSSLTFTAVGRFAPTPWLPGETKFAFEYTDVATLWDCFAGLDPGDRYLRPNHPFVPEQLEHLPITLSEVLKQARIWLGAQYSTQKHFPTEVGNWVSRPHSSAKLQEITEYLVRVL